MGFDYYENGHSVYLDHYDPFPIELRPRRKRRSEDTLPYGWW